MSNVAVAKDAVARLLTASPMYTFTAMLTVWLVPNCTQFTPFADPYMLNTFPLLTSFIQFGGLPLPTDWYELLAPALSVSRIMIPACAALLPCALTTRATIVPSPASGWYTKWIPFCLPAAQW